MQTCTACMPMQWAAQSCFMSLGLSEIRSPVDRSAAAEARERQRMEPTPKFQRHGHHTWPQLTNRPRPGDASCRVAHAEPSIVPSCAPAPVSGLPTPLMLALQTADSSSDLSPRHVRLAATRLCPRLLLARRDCNGCGTAELAHPRRATSCIIPVADVGHGDSGSRSVGCLGSWVLALGKEEGLRAADAGRVFPAVAHQKIATLGSYTR